MSWVIAFCLLTIAASQACPHCKWDSCSTTYYGFQNCSECEYGAYTTVEVYLNGSGSIISQVVGICSPCPTGCTSCQIGQIPVHMAPSFIAVNCSNCVSGYVYNYSSGGCAACPPNCVSCRCGGSMYICTQTFCEICMAGFDLDNSECKTNSTNTTSLQNQKEQTLQTSNEGNSGVIIGLSIWVALMTVITLGFGVLYLKNRSKSTTLLGSSLNQGREVTL